MLASTVVESVTTVIVCASRSRSTRAWWTAPTPLSGAPPRVFEPGRRPRLLSRLRSSEALLSSELVHTNPPKQPPSMLQTELTEEQIALLLEIATPYVKTGSWPIWDFVVKRMDQRKLNARDITASLPRVGTKGTLGPSYGFTVGHDWRMLRDNEPVQLTVAAALVLDELRPLLADPFLRVLHYMIALQRDTEPSPTEVTQTWLDSQELAKAIPSLKPEFLSALPKILAAEPGTWRGSSRGPTLPDDPTWSREITREIQQYAEATDLESYVATVCEIVTMQAWEQSYHHFRTEHDGVPLPREYAAAPWLDPVISNETAEPPVEPESARPIYVKESLIEELIDLDGAGGFVTDKLVQQCKELNFNFRHAQPFSCPAARHHGSRPAGLRGDGVRPGRQQRVVDQDGQGLPQEAPGLPYPGRRCDAPADRPTAEPDRHARRSRARSPECPARRSPQAFPRRPGRSRSRKVTRPPVGFMSAGGAPRSTSAGQLRPALRW